MKNEKNSMSASGGSAAGGKTNFKITNLHCDACVKISSMALKKLPGVKSVEITKDGLATLESDKEISQEEIKNALSEVDKDVSF